MTPKFVNRLALPSLLLSVSAVALAPVALAQDNAAEETSDEIIVTGSPFVRSVDEAITGVSVLSGDELSDRLAATIGETLKLEPGVSSTSFGAGASRPIIRGQGGDRVRVLTNGIGSIDASSASPDHAVAAEPAQAERIEVVRGASLLRYGSSGSGGVVNVIDGRIPQDRVDGVQGSVRLGASSVDEGKEAAAAVDFGLGENFVLHLDGTFRETEDYDIPGYAESALFRALEEAEEGEEEHDDEHEGEEEAFGSLENSAVETDSLTAGLSFISDRGVIGFAVHQFNSDYGIPGGHGHEEEHEEGEEEEHEEGEEEEEMVTIGLEQTRYDLNGALETDGFFEKFQLFAGYADYKHTEFEAPGEVGTVFTNEGYEVRAEAIQADRDGWQAAYGVQLRKRDFSAIGAEAFVPPTLTEQVALYTFHQKEIGDLHLEGAARLESTKQEDAIDGTTKEFDLISVSAGGDIHLTETVRLGGTIFRTDRAPTTEELFSNGPHLATEQFERGDPNLEEETAVGVELALRYRKEDHFFTANLFHTSYDDYIFARETDGEEDGLPVFQFSAVDATFNGLELQGGLELGIVGDMAVAVDGLAEYVRAETDDGNLPRIPPLSFLAGIEAENDQWRFRAEVDHVTEQDDIAEFELPTDGYSMVNAFATWKVPMDVNKLNVSLAVLNLTDEDARQHTSFLKDVVPLPGRNIRFSVSANF